MTIREALLSLAYIEVKPNVWLKPVGFQLFAFKEVSMEWHNWFQDAQGKTSLWERKVILPDIDPLRQLKECETWTRTDLFVNGDSRFELAGIDL